MSPWKKPLLANLILVVLFLGIAVLANAPTIVWLDHVILVSVFMMIMAPVNLIVGIIRHRKKQPDGKIYMIVA